MKSFVSCVLLATIVAANPFTGENKHKEFVYHDNGTISHRLGVAKGTATPFKRYMHNAKPQKSLYQTVHDLAFGESYEQKLFEENVQKAFGGDKKKVAKKGNKHRL